MPKPPRINRPVEKSINLPQDLVGKVDLELFSEVEGRVPFGTWSRLVERLLREWLVKERNVA